MITAAEALALSANLKTDENFNVRLNIFNCIKNSCFAGQTEVFIEFPNENISDEIIKEFEGLGYSVWLFGPKKILISWKGELS